MTALLIGITVGQRDEGSPYVQTRASYTRTIENAGGLPVLIPPLGPDALKALLERLGGIVFPGGADVDPAEYGETREPKTEVVTELDRLELAVAEWAIHSDMPTLGICRGQQLLNVAMGGSLIQHLAGHRQPGDRAALTQQLTVTPGSRLADVLGTKQVDVNHMHHQAVKDVGPGLTAVAWAPDGTIEGHQQPRPPVAADGPVPSRGAVRLPRAEPATLQRLRRGLSGAQPREGAANDGLRLSAHAHEACAPRVLTYSA